jgi:peptidyl-prolyl cis-trans isomerase B (cyclophilin B)
LPVFILLCVLALGACGSTKKSAGPVSPKPPTRDANGCLKVRAPAPKGNLKLPKPTLRLDPAKRYELDVQTTCGDFTIQLDPKVSPKTSASLYYLARKGFFDNLTFHRVAAGFVIQGGDPAGNGSGGPGYTVVEPPPASAKFPRGTIAMAKTQAEPAGASGSQFFVVTGEDATGALQGQYAIGGHVTGGGDEVVQRIGSLPTNPPQDGQPVDPVVILRVIARQR